MACLVHDIDETNERPVFQARNRQDFLNRVSAAALMGA